MGQQPPPQPCRYMSSNQNNQPPALSFADPELQGTLLVISFLCVSFEKFTFEEWDEISLISRQMD